MEFAVILPAAGRSERFGGKDKLLEELAGSTVLQWAVEAFLVRRDVGEIVIATRDEKTLRGVLKNDPRISFCEGGDCRAESVGNALKSVSKSIGYVAIHDAARPLVSQELIERVWAAAREHGAAVPAMGVTSTIKLAGNSLPTRAMGTLPRHMLWAVQTPQMGKRVDFLEAIEAEEARRAGKMIRAECTSPDALQYTEVFTYAPQIQRFYEALGRDRVKVIVFDDFVLNTGQVYRDTLQFLGLDVEFEADFKVVNPVKPVAGL